MRSSNLLIWSEYKAEARLLEKDSRRQVNKVDLLLAANSKKTSNNGLKKPPFGFLKRRLIISKMNVNF